LILGNGDLRDMNDIYQRIQETGVDGVLVGRAAQGNPWLFQTKEPVKQALSSGAIETFPNIAVSLAQRFNVMLEHARHFENQWGAQCFVGMRKHLAWYCQGAPKAAALRAQMVRMSNILEVMKCLDDYRASLGTCREFALPYCKANTFGNGGDGIAPIVQLADNPAARNSVIDGLLMWN
jgi:tRNA-dihydrouridine synthase